MKILFFSYGDPNSPETWSNVPYCFSNALKNNGHEVVTCQLKKYPKLEEFWDKYVIRVIRKVYPGAQYEFMRSWICRKSVNRRIKKIVNNFPDTDLCIFTTFSFGYKSKNLPSLLFCDWTYESHLHRIEHTPYFFEKRYIEYERSILNSANCAISLFPKATGQINAQLGKDVVKWGGISAINRVDNTQFILPEIVDESVNSYNILFIGDGKYIAGANLLLKAFNRIKSRNPNLSLHFVGLTERHLDKDECLSDVFCYGYLNKSKPEDNKLYYSLLRSASIFCNPSEKWGGFSSTIEAMYYATPLLISPYEDFVAQFGEDNNFTIYNSKFDVDELASKLQHFFRLDAKSRKYMSIKSHEAVKDCSWESYSKRILKIAGFEN